MASVDYPEPFKVLVAQLKKLPGIGPKSAERIAIWLMQQGGGVSDSLAESVATAGREIRECEVCGFFSTAEAGCVICSGVGRDRSLLCVVEQPADILPIERSGAYRGSYHALRGRISPLENVGPEDLRISELIARVREVRFSEVILALSADVEGEATGNYLREILSEFPEIRMSRLAQGIPVGGGLENADELTLFRAMEGRVVM